jgi:hypothetical protein
MHHTWRAALSFVVKGEQIPCSHVPGHSSSIMQGAPSVSFAVQVRSGLWQ